MVCARSYSEQGLDGSAAGGVGAGGFPGGFPRKGVGRGGTPGRDGEPGWATVECKIAVPGIDGMNGVYLYNGMDQRFLGAARGMLSKMPDGRCTYPPGDKPGMLGFDKRGHYVGGEEVH